MSKFLEGLNPQQKEVVLNTDGQLMVLAGAGSGKTKTIIARICYLVKDKNIIPWKILAVTFSNRAAKEMKERIHQQLPEYELSNFNISTFHAFCAKMLRYNGDKIGLDKQFTIYDDSEVNSVIKHIIKERDLDPKKTTPGMISSFIDKLHNEGHYIGRKKKLSEKILKDPLYSLYLDYETELARSNAVDFGGLITKCIKLLEEHKEVLDYYNDKFDYVLVDEYQDTNLAQFDLMNLLVEKKKNICVVGDEDQCLIEGTKIKISNNKEKAIESLKVGDRVLTVGNKLTQITKVVKKEIKKNLIQIKTYNSQITCTENHCLFVQKNDLQNLSLISLSVQYSNVSEFNKEIIIGEYVAIKKLASQITSNDKLIDFEGNLCSIKDISLVSYSGNVYDLDIESVHHYFANGVLSHNSIYSWRGAEIKNILDYEKTYPKAQIFRLEQNYRSTKSIVEASKEVINKNLARKGKNMFTSNDDGKHISLIECVNGYLEAEYVAQQISEVLRRKVSPKEIAVFYRNNAQSRTFEDAFRRSRIPYKIIGGMRFYERREIKDILSYLKVLINPTDDMATIRAIQNPSRGVGDKSIEKLVAQSRENGRSLYQELLQVSKEPVKKLTKIQQGIIDFVKIIENAKLMIEQNCTPYEIYEMVLEGSEYIEILDKSSKHEDQARIDNLNELKTSILQFQKSNPNLTLTEYLESVTLDFGSEEDQGPTVSLMTIHASKGLEFDHVYLVGAEEGIFPSPMALNDGLNSLEEERRLFYVAVTRAKKELSILYCLSRVLYGKMVFSTASRFLRDIPIKYVKKFKINDI